jgi:hypothetical protein
MSYYLANAYQKLKKKGDKFGTTWNGKSAVPPGVLADLA